MLSLAEAQSSGASALRLAPAGIVQPAKGSSLTVAAALNALNSGEVRPWFQPQLSTDTGRVSGVEALARWVHPKRGLIPPGEFLGLIESAGAMERLGDVILTDSLTALADWDSQGLHVPGVSVNLSDAELRNPHLADKILWELDRHNMPSHRLRVEVLETVVLTGPNQIASLNLDKLAKAGCRVDLDDFGTGNASIAALQKLNIACLKIDRSFVSRLDRDENQRRLVSAILSMAERLGVETLAEGVESAGEHSLLAQLGCDHVQGFGIARPMAADQLATWVREHDAKPGQARWPSQDAG
jgi:EAL domain-containing protein (putative c-di-GMP-specific phosphodiesterase class I)